MRKCKVSLNESSAEFRLLH